jgi:hypothetical protein
MLSVPLDNATENSHTLVWNDALRVFSGVWTGWNASCFAYCSPLTGNRLRIGQNGAGKVKEWLDYVPAAQEDVTTFQDDGVVIPSSITTKSYTFGGISNKKTPYIVRADFYGCTADSTLSIQFDRFPPIQILSIPASGGPGIVFPLMFPIFFPGNRSFPAFQALQALGQFTEASFTLTTASKKLNLNSLAFGAWNDTISMATPGGSFGQPQQQIPLS